MNEIRHTRDPGLPLLSSIVYSNDCHNGICQEAKKHGKINVNDERLSTYDGMKAIAEELRQAVISFYKKEEN
jgi:hypothetical protein